MKSAALQSAILELLEEESGTPTQIRQRLETAGAPLKFATIETTLQALQRLGRVIRCADGVYARAENPAPPAATPPAEPTETTMATKTCPTCKKTKPESEFVQNGKCKLCNRAYMAQYREPKKGRRANGEKPAPAKAPRVPRPHRGSMVVDHRISINIVDVDDRHHTFTISARQALELRQALAGITLGEVA